MCPDRKTSLSIPAAEPRGRSRRARVRAALAAFRGAASAARDAALAHAPRARRVAVALSAAAVAAWAGARRRPDAVLAAVLLLGVFLMVLHWKGSPIEPEAAHRDEAPHQAVAGP